MKDLLQEYIRLALQEASRSSLKQESWDERYEPATAQNLMLAEPGQSVEPDVRSAIAKYLKTMGLMTGDLPKKFKSHKKKAIRA